MRIPKSEKKDNYLTTELQELFESMSTQNQTNKESGSSSSKKPGTVSVVNTKKLMKKIK